MRLIQLTALLNYTALWTRRDSHLEFCCAGDICVREKHRTVCKSCEFHMSTARKLMSPLQSEIRFFFYFSELNVQASPCRMTCVQQYTLEKLFSGLLVVETLYSFIEKAILLKQENSGAIFHSLKCVCCLYVQWRSRTKFSMKEETSRVQQQTLK